MVSRVKCGAVIGVGGCIVEAEAFMTNGSFGFEIVGLPDSAVRESKERVIAAIKNSGYMFPIKRITINLSPADIRKEGPSYDLPIALSILSCMGVVKSNAFPFTLFTGELSLDGKINSVSGVLPMVCGAYNNGLKNCVVPETNALEAAVVKGVAVVGAATLKGLVEHLNGKTPIADTVVDIDEMMRAVDSEGIDFAEVKGQRQVKRALEVAAAGAHNVLMIGPPGSGKTMMAKRLPSILPPLTFEESLEVTTVYSVARMLADRNALIASRPFRAPHHEASDAALTGGGKFPRPGEISLAHQGVLFLDEMPEFHKNVLEVLRQPLEDGYVTIARASGTVTFPSDFMLVGAMNPCPCGFYGDSDKCKCTGADIQRYLGKISGPLLDRIDIHIEASRVNYDEIGSREKAERSSAIKGRVMKAIEIQRDRFKGSGIRSNMQMSVSQIEEFCRMSGPCEHMISAAFDSMGLSARAYHKILKVARTVADLAGCTDIREEHLAEAIHYRSLDRKYWSR